MVKGSAGHGTRPSNRLSHGLASRKQSTLWADEADALVTAVLEGTPQTAEIVSVATDLAQVMLHLRAIDAEEMRLLTTLPPPRDFDTFVGLGNFEDFRHEVIDSGFCEKPPPGSRAAKLVRIVRYPERAAQYRPTLENTAVLIVRRRAEFRRLEDYRRRALSRRYKLINRLDYLVIEELRRRARESRTE